MQQVLDVTAPIYLLARRARHNGRQLAAWMTLGASASNSGFVGYPIAAQVLGPVAGIALALCVFVENLLVIPVGLALAGDSKGPGKKALPALLATTARGLLRNPLIVATLAGLVVSAPGWQLPSAITRTLDIAAGAASPTALFVIGGSQVGLQLGGICTDLALIAGGKLLLHPLCVLLMVWLLPPMGPVFGTAAVLFAAMPIMGLYPVLSQRRGLAALCSAALLVATVAWFFTVSVMTSVVPSLAQLVR